MEPISQQIRSFSPAEQIYLKSLGLEDKNGNGVIDEGADEGYEQFIARYGNADIGFYINGIIQSANDGKLTINEIVNHYYTKVRFDTKFDTETKTIDQEVNAYMYANSVPLVWLDDKQGTVMNEVNKILGMGWNERKVTEDEAIRMFRNVMQQMKVIGRTGNPSDTGYHTLPELIAKKSGYCFEVAQFGFWFFSQLKLNSIEVGAMLTPNLAHGVIKLTKTSQVFDHFNVTKPPETNPLFRVLDRLGLGTKYTVANEQWHITNPLQSIGEFYVRQGRNGREQAVIYNKYNLSAIADLMEAY